MTLAGTAWSGPDKPEPQIRLEIDLVDGSRIIGTPSIDDLSVQTSYAKMDIPLHQILTIKMGEDHETAAFDLRNGDKIKGVLTLAPVKLKTVFGKVSIGIEHINQVRVVLPGGVLPEALRKGLVLHYTFDRDDGDRVDDQSGMGNHGLVEGAQWMPRDKGGALRLANARSAVRVPHNRTLNTPDALSVFVWVKGERLSQQNHANLCGALVNKFYKNNIDPTVVPTDGAGWLLQVHAWGCPGAVSGGVWNKAIGWSGDGTALVADGTWHFIGMVYAGGSSPSVRFYVDGIEDAASVVGGTLPASIGDNDRDLYVGRWVFDSVHPPFRGEIDELRIFNRALTTEDVKLIYDLQKGGG